MANENKQYLLTFGGHLEVLRRMLFRIIAVAGTIAIVIFCFKDSTWRLFYACGCHHYTTRLDDPHLSHYPITSPL